MKHRAETHADATGRRGARWRIPPWTTARALALWGVMMLVTAANVPESRSSIGRPYNVQDAVRSRLALRSAATRMVLAVKGDWGSGAEAQWSVTRRMCLLRRNQSFRAVVTTGDNFYNPDGVATERNYGDPERCLTSQPGHRWLPAWGNHDLAGRSTATVLGAPGRWYRWAAGGVEIIVLDSNRWSDAAQRRWLARSLRRFNVPVTMAVFHHPPYSVGAVHGSHQGVRESWVPLFQRHGVDLVLSGHNHLYEHSRVRGIDYVVTGGGGAALYRCGDSAAWTRRCVSAHHFLVIEALGSTLRVRAVTPSGKILDRFVVQAEG
jgi:hypothetical protein